MLFPKRDLHVSKEDSWVRFVISSFAFSKSGALPFQIFSTFAGNGFGPDTRNFDIVSQSACRVGGNKTRSVSKKETVSTVDAAEILNYLDDHVSDLDRTQRILLAQGMSQVLVRLETSI